MPEARIIEFPFKLQCKMQQLEYELLLARNTLIKLSCFSVDGISDAARDVASQAATRIKESGLVK